MGESKRRKAIDPNYGSSSHLQGTIYIFDPEGRVDREVDMDEESIRDVCRMGEQYKPKPQQIIIVIVTGDGLTIIENFNIQDLNKALEKSKNKSESIKEIMKNISEICESPSKYLILNIVNRRFDNTSNFYLRELENPMLQWNEHGTAYGLIEIKNRADGTTYTDN
jgi:hypothetical protein